MLKRNIIYLYNTKIKNTQKIHKTIKMRLIDAVFEFLFFTVYLNLMETIENINMDSKDFHHYWKNASHFFDIMTKMLYPMFYDEDNENNKESLTLTTNTKEEVKYENKYLEEVRAMVNEYTFSYEDKQLEEREYKAYVELEEALLIEKKMELEKKIQECDAELGRKVEIFEMSNNLDEYEEYVDNLEKTHKEASEQLELLYKEKVDLAKQREKARNHVIHKKNLKLKNCYVMEYTPVGNVVMFYNEEKEAFEYYSDHSVPYRFLDVVARKYVKTYNCKPLYVDMEEELRIQKKKKEEEEEKKKIEEEQKKKEKEEKMQTVVNATDKEKEKKNVFAKFKTYNKEAGSGRVNSAPPPKNSIPNKSVTAEENKNVCLKERANHYTCEGRFANFNILKKISRKLVDKKYALTFAEFKKMKGRL